MEISTAATAVKGGGGGDTYFPLREMRKKIPFSPSFLVVGESPPERKRNQRRIDSPEKRGTKSLLTPDLGDGEAREGRYSSLLRSRFAAFLNFFAERDRTSHITDEIRWCV